MITVYSIVMNVYRDDLMEIIGFFPSADRLKVMFAASDNSWCIQSTHIALTGGFKGKRLRIMAIQLKTEDGVEIIRQVAKLCKGTIIAVVDEPIRKALYITKGQEELDATLLDDKGERFDPSL